MKHELATEDPGVVRQVDRAHRAGLWVGIVIPLVVIAATLAVIASWVPRLPDPLATHWSFSGQPDGFSRPVTFLLIAGATMLALCLAMTGPLLLARRAGVPSWSRMHRMLIASALGITVFLASIFLGTTRAQLDLASAHAPGAEQPAIGTVLAIAAVLGLLAGGAGWFLQPNVVVDSAVTVDGRSLPTPGATQWATSTQLGTPLMIVIASVLVITAALGAVIYSEREAAWLLILGLFALIAMAFAATSRFHVRIDPTGFEARSTLGWPSFRIPLAEVASAALVEVEPFAQFGGWGVRKVPGKFGVILRRGPGIEITRTDGRVFVITVPDAAAGAALLASLAHGLKATPGADS